MKLSSIALAVVLAGTAAAAAAQHQHPHGKSSTLIVVEDGNEMTLTGCVRRTPEGNYSLTNAAGSKGAVGTYLLAVTDDEEDLDELEEHLGHRVEVKGKAADKGKGRIKVHTKSESKKPEGGKARTETTSEVKGDLEGLPFLGIKSFRMLASVCP
jgi:hypothetical protein